MNIKEYLDTTGISVAAFAKISKISVASAYQYLNGKIPRIRAAKKIQSATHERIKIKDLIPTYRKK